MLIRTSTLSGLILTFAGLCACTSHTAPGEWPAYPGHAQDSVVNVQAFRDGSILAFTNTSGRPLGPGRLWINGAFSTPIEQVEAGAHASVDLNNCRNEFGQPFRGGGFFATERPDDVVLVQLHEESGEMTGLIVTTRTEGLTRSRSR